MRNINQITHRTIAMVLFCLSLGLSAQNKTQKSKQDFKTNKDVSIIVDTKHTNIVFETWNKNSVEVEAYLETKDGKNSQKLLNNWDFNVSGDKNQVRIYSGGAMGVPPVPPVPMPPLEGLNEMMTQLVGPMLEGISENPLPPSFYSNLSSLSFNYAEYEKDGEVYMKKWEKQVEKNFGKEFEKEMEEWAKQMEADAEKMSAKLEARMEAWEKEHGAEFEKEMEAWGEEFGKQMEAWGEEFGKQMEAQMSQTNAASGTVRTPGGADAKRTIIIRMPKDAVLRLNVRHGEVKLAELARNINANLTHTRLAAGTIDGEKTSINTSYGPVLVKNWNYGVLNMRYVKNCTIENAKSIKLTSNSSDVNINHLSEVGLLSGTFGKLNIRKLAPNFRTLTINLENSNLVLQLPDAPLNFSYNGSQSNIKYPAAIKAKPQRSYDSELINGYYKSSTGDNSISIKAKYSDVLVQ